MDPLFSDLIFILIVRCIILPAEYNKNLRYLTRMSDKDDDHIEEEEDVDYEVDMEEGSDGVGMDISGDESEEPLAEESDVESEGEVALETDTEEEEEEEDRDRKKKDEKDDDGVWIVSGYTYCLNKNSQEGGFNFIVKDVLHPKKGRKKKEVPKIFQIRRFSALPTYCPWICYELKVEKPKNSQGCIHVITEIISCKYREIKKNDIKKYIIDQRTMTEDDEKMFEERVKKTFRKVPKVIRCKSDLKLNMTDPYIMEIALEILAPCFRCSSILSLLPYFPYTFVSWMNEEQSTAMLAMIYHSPHIFCFWDKFVSMATSIMNGKKLLFPKRDKLELDQGYVYKLKERLNDITGELVYDARNPCWTVRCLKKAVGDFKNIFYDEESLSIIDIAMRIYIAFHEEKNSFKNSTYDVIKLYNVNEMRDQEMIDRVDRAIEFLSEKKILCTKGDLNDFFSRKCMVQMKEKLARMRDDNTFFLLNDSKYVVMDINICIQEIEMAMLLVEKRPDMRIFVCRDYSDEYLSGLRTMINGRMMKEDTVTKTVWLSPNKVCAGFMKRATGLDFKVISSYVRDIKKTRTKKMESVKAIAFDRFNKYSILEVIEILRICPDHCIIYIFGDIEDYGPNSKKGTHHLMSEFCGIFSHDFMPSDDRSDIAMLREKLRGGNIGDLDVKKLEKNKDLHQVIYEIEEKIYGKKKKRKHSTVHRTALNEMNNDSYHIFCTSEADKDAVLTLFMEKKNGRLYVKGDFMLWDKATVVNDGNIGRIEEIWKSDIHGNKNYKVSDAKRSVNIYRSPHIFKFFGDTENYNTSRVSIVHSEVDVLSKFSGASTSYVILVAGQNTSYTDIEIAAKYARKELKLLLLPEVSIDKLYSYRKNILERQYKSDLTYKLSFFLK